MTFRSITADPSVKDQKLKAGTIKRIANFATPYKWHIVFFLITVVIDAFLIVATPLLLRKLIDEGVIPQNAALVTKLAMLVGLLAVADSLMSIIGRWFSSRIGEGLIFDLLSLVFSHVQKQSIAFFTRTQTGALISRINSDVIGAQQAFTSTLSGVVSNVVSLVLVAVTMLILSWQITIVSLILLPLFLLPTKWVGKKLQSLTRASFQVNAEMSSTMTERFNVSGAMLVALYGKPANEHEYFSSRARKVADIGISIALLNRIFFVALTSVAAVATAFAYGIGGHLAISGTVTVGTPRADEISLASLESVSKPETVPSGEVLRNVSFIAQPGTMTAVVGPSGAGKTTISALIPRLYDVTSGAILVGGIDIRGLTLESLRSCIGVVMQDAHLFHETIAANLRYAKPDATFEQMREACRSARIWSLIESLPNGFETMVGERGHRLSGGEKQRIAIARLLLKQPSVVILDEATAHLDSENEALVHEALSIALKGRTSIVIAHRLSTVMEADQILVLDKGVIVECGKHEELVARKGLYAELYARQDLSAPA